MMLDPKQNLGSDLEVAKHAATVPCGPLAHIGMSDSCCSLNVTAFCFEVTQMPFSVHR